MGAGGGHGESGKGREERQMCRCTVAGQGGQAGWCFPGLDVRGPRHVHRETLMPLDSRKLTPAPSSVLWLKP